ADVFLRQSAFQTGPFSFFDKLFQTNLPKKLTGKNLAFKICSVKLAFTTHNKGRPVYFPNGGTLLC
ncbi:MAG: hypothetical protein IJ508_05020, partial [Oscillospiraceae bacterium]|nr:hypothetical protein [Oscillospiraceae bacterium]